MSLGFDPEPNIVNLNDTADVRAFLYDENDAPVSADDLVSVNFTIQKPDKVKVTQAGDVQDDGSGLTKFNQTTEVGEYLGVATFTYLNGDKKSSRCDFEVVDPFKSATPSPSYVVAITAWSKIEDCFDAEDEGPWLQEVTKNTFNKDKMQSFIADSLYDINQVNPPTNLDLTVFAYVDQITGNTLVTADLPLMTQALFIVVLRHLMRSYVEQPNPVGANIAWQDRRDYLPRWQQIYQIEFQQYERMLRLFKRRYLGLGRTKGLVSTKAGRLLPAPMRTRFIGRGYW